MKLNKSHFSNLMETASFIHDYIKSDLGEETHKIATRFPPEPNGFIHIGNLKAIYISYGMALLYDGTFNLRMDDTNPAREDEEYVESIKEDMRWMGFDWGDRLFFGSDCFDVCYDVAVKLIKEGLAFVCDLSAEELRAYRGTLTEKGRESPYKSRSIEENLALFERMRAGEFEDGAKTLRAKIDMASPNLNMRDPVIYRISHAVHHNTGDKWCIYPMYDFAHPIQDAVEGITHSLCSIEFADHRPLYNWVVDGMNPPVRPRQIEFAKMNVGNMVMGKRYLRKLVEEGIVDGWDDPRMATAAGMRRRGYTPAGIIKFLDITGVSTSPNSIDFSMLEHCVRDDLSSSSKVVMAALDPIKLTIINYPDNQTEYFNDNQSFSKHLCIERADYMENAPNKYHRLTEGREVRLKGAYFVKCVEAVKDGAGNVTEVLCTYDPETRSGSGFDGRKVKGTIQWVNQQDCVNFTANLYDNLVHDDPNSPDGFSLNPDSLIVMKSAVGEASLASAALDDRFQFMRNGYFCLDSKTSGDGALVFNRIVALKSSYRG